MSSRNSGVEFDPSWFSNVYINLPAVKRRAESLGTRRTVKKHWQAAWLLRAVTCIDLTTLSGDDTPSNVQRLCYKAKHPIREDLLKALGMQDKGVTVGAVCVYPNRVTDAAKALKAVGGSHVPIASVATGFPAGQTPLKTRLEEIRLAVEDGAGEIDVVINRAYALAGNWQGVYDEIREMKQACGSVHMKVILAVGELGSLVNVYKASMVAMMAEAMNMASIDVTPGEEDRDIWKRNKDICTKLILSKVSGGDFIKTSTGKEGVNANLMCALVMVRAIREFRQRTGIKVGFKPAGGIRSAKDSLTWLSLMKEELGDDWMRSDLFRFGASGLLGDIERQLFHCVTGRYAAAHELPMA